MGRPLRLKAPNVVYHITSRTNGKRLYLKSKKDHKALCRCLERIRLKYKALVYKYLPMGNHFHLVIQLPDNSDLSQFMCEFKARYAKYYNRRYNTSGHFWGERFHSTIVQADQHLLACFRYVDLNPVKAGLVQHPSQWEHHCYPYYAHGQEHADLIISPHEVYISLSRDETRRREIYREFVTDGLPEKANGISRIWRQQVFGDAAFAASLLHK